MAEWINDELVLLEKVATGGMAEVYRGIQFGPAGFERPVAVKRVLPHLAADAHFRAQFEYEVRLSARLNHKNIVQVFFADNHQDTQIIVLEYVDGVTLSALQERCFELRTQLTPAFAAFVGAEIATGLDFAHTLTKLESEEPLNLVHRDISPQNVMLTFRGAVKILDFGIARAADRTGFTKTGDLRGKPGYIAPEYITKGQLDRRADIFALGVVLYELLSGIPLFPGPSMPDFFAQVTAHRPLSLRQVRPDIPEPLDAAILRAIDIDPAKRFQSAADFASQLRRFSLLFAPRFGELECGQVARELFSDHIEIRRTKATRDTHRARSSRPLRKLRKFGWRMIDPSRPLLPGGTALKVALLLLIVTLNLVYLDHALLAPPHSPAIPLEDDVIAWFQSQVAPPGGAQLRRWAAVGGHVLAYQDEKNRRPLLHSTAPLQVPSLRFDGDDFLETQGITEHLTNASGISVITVANVTGTGTNLLWSLQSADKTFDVTRLGVHLSRFLFFKLSPTVGDFEYIPKFNLGSLCLISFTMDTLRGKVFLNGQLESERELSIKPNFAQPTAFTVGQRYDNGKPADFLTGELYELVVLDRAISEKRRKSIEDYLRNRYPTLPALP